MLDQLNSVTAEDASQTAFLIISAIQDLDQAEQVAGAAFLFLLLAKRFDLSPGRTRRVLEQSEARLADCLTPQAKSEPGEYARAIRQYLKDEL